MSGIALQLLGDPRTVLAGGDHALSGLHGDDDIAQMRRVVWDGRRLEGRKGEHVRGFVFLTPLGVQGLDMRIIGQQKRHHGVIQIQGVEDRLEVCLDLRDEVAG